MSWIQTSVDASSKRWPWPSSIRNSLGFLISSRSHPLPEIAHVCARATGRFRKREGGEKGERVIVRYGATIIKGKYRSRDSSVMSRGGRNFSSLSTYTSIRCRAGCRESLCIRWTLCGRIYYVSSAEPVRVRLCHLGDGYTGALAIAHSYARNILLHPRLVHHAYRAALRWKLNLHC